MPTSQEKDLHAPEKNLHANLLRKTCMLPRKTYMPSPCKKG